MRKIIISTLFFLIVHPFISALDNSLFFTAGPKLLLNTDDNLKSAPSPVMYSLGIGGDFIFSNGFSLEAHSSFFTNYYLWDGDEAQPAEVENRTATALSALLDLSCGCTFKFGKNKKHQLALLAGTAFFARHAILSNGVNENDPNRLIASTAKDDVSNINGTFFKGLNFFYPETAISWSYILSDIWKIGVETRAYFPLASFIDKNSLDGMIFSLALKLSYK